MKQLLVELIVTLWAIMPRRARLWAYMNDSVPMPPYEIKSKE